MSRTPAPTGSLWGPVPEPTPPAVDPNIADLPDDPTRLSGQNGVVLGMLKAGERLTPQAAYCLGITRLAARIHDIRKAGYSVQSEYDTAAKCAVYWLEATGKNKNSCTDPAAGVH